MIHQPQDITTNLILALLAPDLPSSKVKTPVSSVQQRRPVPIPLISAYPSFSLAACHHPHIYAPHRSPFVRLAHTAHGHAQPSLRLYFFLDTASFKLPILMAFQSSFHSLSFPQSLLSWSDHTTTPLGARASTRDNERQRALQLAITLVYLCEDERRNTAIASIVRDKSFLARVNNAMRVDARDLSCALIRKC